MNALQRARLYVFREKKKSIRLGLILLLLAVFLLLCIWIYQSNQAAAAELRQTISATFRIDDNDGSAVDDALIRQVLDNGNIRAYNGENVQHLYSKSVIPVPGYFAGSGEEAEYMMRYYANHSSELEQSFQNGSLTLAEGRHILPEDTNCALISTDLAQQNGLRVGDTLQAGFAPSAIEQLPASADRQFQFTIVGIFAIQSAPSSSTPVAETDMIQNAIFIDAAAGHTLSFQDLSHSCYGYGVTFFVTDPKELPDTLAALNEKIDPSRYTVTVNDKDYREAVMPLEQMSRLMQGLILILSGSSIILLSLILILWIRQRTHELGIYLSIGIRKRNILSQFLAESLSIGLISCSAAIPVTLLTTVIAGGLLNNDIAVSLTILDFVLIFALVLLITTLSTCIASFRLLRMRPRQILSQLS